MKNLKFKIVAVLLIAASALLYNGCQKDTPAPAPKKLGGTSWVVTKVGVEFFARANGIALYGENLTDLMKIKFDENTAIRTQKDVDGSGGEGTFNFTYDGFEDLRFTGYPNSNVLIGDQGIYIGSGLTNVYYISSAKVTALSDNNMTWVVDLGKAYDSLGNEIGWIYRNQTDGVTYKAGTAIATIQLEKQK